MHLAFIGIGRKPKKNVLFEKKRKRIIETKKTGMRAAGKKQKKRELPGRKRNEGNEKNVTKGRDVEKKRKMNGKYGKKRNDGRGMSKSHHFKYISIGVCVRVFFTTKTREIFLQPGK